MNLARNNTKIYYFSTEINMNKYLKYYIIFCILILIVLILHRIAMLCDENPSPNDNTAQWIIKKHIPKPIKNITRNIVNSEIISIPNSIIYMGSIFLSSWPSIYSIPFIPLMPPIMASALIGTY